MLTDNLYCDYIKNKYIIFSLFYNKYIGYSTLNNALRYLENYGRYDR